jgi:hypothetical protein
MRRRRPPGLTVPNLDVTGKSASEQGSRHDDTKDPVGARIDLSDLRVAHHPLDWEVDQSAGPRKSRWLLES